jgi:hypothetical protein
VSIPEDGHGPPVPAPRQRRESSSEETEEAFLPTDHPAYDRVQSPTPAGGLRSPGALRRIALALALVGVGLLATYFFLRPGGGAGEAPPDLLELAALHAEEVELLERTDDLDLAQAFIYEEFGWPVRVPVLPGTRLLGVGIEELTDGVEVPVLQYQPDEGSPVTVFLFDYAFLDAAAGHVQLAPPIYARLAEDEPVDVRRVEDAYLVLWRRRAAIYTAVTTDEPGALVEYLRGR